jgi:hypothetical protein
MFALDEKFYQAWALAGDREHARCLASQDLRKNKIEIGKDRNMSNINIKN